MLTYADV
jgi:hypothetical protein